MIKLLIVDDEEEIRTGIRSIIPWESYGIEVCGEAENGRRALELINQLSPDIILIDIRMPIIDGLQVIETLKAANSPVKSIILSGYDDFSYAQKALKFGTSEYLLKPCLPEEILNTVLKVKLLIENELSRNEKLNILKLKFNESLPLLKEKLLVKLIRDSEENTVDTLSDFKYYKINLISEAATVAVFKIDEYSKFCENRKTEDIELMKFAIKNIAAEILNSKLQCEIFESTDEIIAIVNTLTGNDYSTLYCLLEDVIININKHLGLSLSIGIGKSHDITNELHLSYDEALKSLNLKFFTGSNSIIKYEDIQEYAVHETTYPLNEEKELLNCIKTNKTTELDNKLDGFLTAVHQRNKSKDYHLKAGLALLFSVYHLCIENNIETEEIFGISLSSLDNILRLDSLTNLKASLFEIITASTEKINSLKSKNSIVSFIVKFIDENCHKDLSLESIAREVFITPGYVSLLFKQHIGINFVDYLHKVRINKACDLLKDIKLKMYEVSYSVGYNDEKYFSQVFKKYTGKTPTQFREGLTF